MEGDSRPAWRNRGAPVIALVAVVLILALCTVGVEGPAARVIPAVIGGGAVAAAVWAVRRWRSDRAEYERRLTEWAATEAVLAERLRIARDLHDLVSHGLGLITVRAAATRHLEQSAEVRSALNDIERTSRDATAELRRMLTVLRAPETVGIEPHEGEAVGGGLREREAVGSGLREGETAGSGEYEGEAAGSGRRVAESAPRAPVDGLETLPEIVRAAETAGIRARLTVEEVGVVAPGVQVALCRVVREGLANVARHAGPTGAGVRVWRDGDHVTVTVADAGPLDGWRAVPGAGHGLAGLRERVGSLGGTVVAEPVDGGFRLTARVPDGERRSAGR